jgi:hypothetical protein
MADENNELSSWREVYGNELASWRDVYGESQRPAARQRDTYIDTDFLHNKLARLAELGLTSVALHRQFVVSLKAAITNENTLQDPELQQLVEDFSAMVLGYYTHDSAKCLHKAYETVTSNSFRGR